MRAVVYRRVSTEEQAARGYSLESQWQACRERALACGAAELIDCADEGVPGDVLNRPGLNRARELAEQRAVSLLVVYDPDRLSRKLTHQLLLTEEFERRGVRLEFVNFEWRATPEGRLFYSLRGAIAEYEKAKIAERTRRGRLAKARRGLMPISAPPYGYRYADSALAVEPSEAGWVEALFRWAATEQLGLKALAERLTLFGAPTRRGGPWRPQTVSGILTNPAYTGLVHVNRFDTEGMSGNRFRPVEDRVRRRLRPEAEWIPIPVPPLVDPARWQQVQELRQAARRKWCGARGATGRYLLSGLLRCGAPSCGRPMRGFPSRKRLYYQCQSKWSAAPCAARLTDARRLDAAVWELLCGWLRRPELAAPDRTGTEADDAEREAALLRAELARLGREERVILQLARRQVIGLRQAESELAGIQRRRELLGQELLEQAASRDGPPCSATGSSQLGPHLDALPFPARRLLVRQLVREVVVRSEGAEVHAMVPAAFL
jgi:site-specific DNA recombinase